MHIKKITQYAINTLLFLGQHGGVASKKDICVTMHIPESYFDKMAKILKENGLINNHMGSLGGFSLAKSPNQISAYQIFSIMEGAFNDDLCLIGNAKCCCTDKCSIKKLSLSATDHIKQTLSRQSLGDILRSGQMEHFMRNSGSARVSRV